MSRPGSTPTRIRPDLWQRYRFWVLGAIAACVSSIPPLERMLVTGFTSDDAAWQVALSTWRPWEGDLILPENTYVLHMPLFTIANLVLPAGRWSIFAPALVLHTVGLMLVVSFARHAVAQVRRVDVTELRWWQDLLVIGSVAAYQLALPDTRIANAGVTTRNLEAGLYLLAIRLGFEIVSGRRAVSSVRHWAFVSAVVAVLALNDPLSVVTIVAPMVTLTALGIGWRRVRGVPFDPRWSRARSLAIAASIGIVGWIAIRVALPSVGVEQRSSGTEFAPLGDVRRHAGVVARGLWDMVGGGLGSDPSLLIRVIGGLLVVAALSGVAAVVSIVWRNAQGGSQWGVPWLAVLALLWLGIVATTYMFSSAGTSAASFRYVIVASPAVGVALAVGTVVAPPVSRAAVGAVAFVSVVFAGTTGIVRDDSDVEALLPDVADEVEQLAALGYDRGYSGYWTSSIVTLLSGHAAPVLPAQCVEGGQSVPHAWLVDDGQFERARTDPGDRSFIIVDRRDGLRLTCPEPDLVQQHGRPSEVIEVSPEIDIWLYPDRDVVADMSNTSAREP